PQKFALDVPSELMPAVAATSLRGKNDARNRAHQPRGARRLQGAHTLAGTCAQRYRNPASAGGRAPCVTADLLYLLWDALVLHVDRSSRVCSVQTDITPPRPPSPRESPRRLRLHPRPGRPSGRRPRPRRPLALRRGFPATFRGV